MHTKLTFKFQEISHCVFQIKQHTYLISYYNSYFYLGFPFNVCRRQREYKKIDLVIIYKNT